MMCVCLCGYHEAFLDVNYNNNRKKDWDRRRQIEKSNRYTKNKERTLPPDLIDTHLICYIEAAMLAVSNWPPVILIP